MTVESRRCRDHTATSIVEYGARAASPRASKAQGQGVADALVDSGVERRLNRRAAAGGLVFSWTVKREHLIDASFAVRFEGRVCIVMHADLFGGSEILIAG